MRTSTMNITMKHCVAALGILAIASIALPAQQTSAGAGPRWQSWIGCWTAAPAGESAFAPAPVSGPVVCITPSLGEAVDVTTLNEGKVVSTQRIDASGADRPVDAKGCTGVQRARWSSDERRIYLRSESTCDGLKSTTSGILAMTASGEWLDVRGVTSYGNTNVRVARYRDAGIPAAIPTEVANVLRERSGSSEAARLAAGAAVGTTAVIEASRAADSAVVAAWLLEREQRFSVDAKTLLKLADAGVPGAVTDALVAVSNPQVFHFARASDQVALAEADISTPDERPLERRPRVSAMGMPYDPWSWGYSGYGYPFGYGYGSLGYGRYPGYGYGTGYGYGYYGGYAPPIIVVTDAQAQSRGQMVKGRGYTQTQGSSSGTASERPRSTYNPPPPSSSSSGSSSSSSSGSESSGSSGRTAKPRP